MPEAVIGNVNWVISRVRASRSEQAPAHRVMLSGGTIIVVINLILFLAGTALSVICVTLYPGGLAVSIFARA